jgi:Protein phosphatase 2C
LATDLPCQDSCLIRQLPSRDGDVLLAVVADGAGSAAFAQVGSQLACNTLVEAIASWIFENGIRDISRDVVLNQWLQGRVLGAFAIQAEAAELRLRDFATTLLGILVSDDRTVCFQVGDGAIVFSSGTKFDLAFWPQNGEYANTTNFLTDPNLSDSLLFLVSEAPVDEVALLSDGLQMLALDYASRTPHQPFFAPMFSRLRIEQPGESPLCIALEEFLNSDSINSRTDDDKTLVLATRRAAKYIAQ